MVDEFPTVGLLNAKSILARIAASSSIRRKAACFTNCSAGVPL
jgi:hypothetical protein